VTDRIRTNLKISTLNSKIQDELIILIKTIVTQNYFEAENSFLQQHEGTPIGSPISGILAEIFLQYLEEAHYPNFIKKISILSA
jgi:retron-type reverse transcriptase